jgi:hypothetical protein
VDDTQRHPANTLSATYYSMKFNVSADTLLMGPWGEQWPRRVKERIDHPVTPEIQQQYDDYVARFNAAKEAFDAIVREGERLNWASGGYSDEEPSLIDLAATVEFVYQETYDEYRDRVLNIVRHHNETGEWLEEPQPTWIERMLASDDSSTQ